MRDPRAARMCVSCRVDLVSRTMTPTHHIIIRMLKTLTASLLLAAAHALLMSPVSAAWTSFSLPPLSQGFGSYWMEHLADGRVLYASNNDLDRQTTFGISGLDDYANALTWDPSTITLLSDSLGAIGVGGFGPSPIYVFDPSSLSTGFNAIPGISIQSYSMAFRDAGSLLVAGGNGTALNQFSLPKYAISIVSLTGDQNKILIDNISNFAGAITLDISGNLYVADNDFQFPRLYRFSAAQLTAAISGPALSIEDGIYLGDLRADGSLAVDAAGRVWSAGFQISGIDLFDPANGTLTNFAPALDNTNYVVSTFSAAGENYVSYLNAAGSASGSAVTYGYERSSVLVPEPGSAMCLVLGLGLLCSSRRRTRK